MGESAHLDRFVLDNLPPENQRPVLLLEGLDYPPRLNAAVELLRRAKAAAGPQAAALLWKAGRMSWRARWRRRATMRWRRG